MKSDRPQGSRFGSAGTTLIELMVAVLILIVASVGLLGLFTFCTGQNKTQGEVASRVTEYCEDKMEQLMALQFNSTTTDTTTDTTQIPWTPTTYNSGYAAWSATTPYAAGANVNYQSTSYVSNKASNLGYGPGTTSVPTGGTGLGGTAASTTYGPVPLPPPYPTTGTCGFSGSTPCYVDYLDQSGNLQGTPNYTTPFYVRWWSIQNNAAGTLKTITVQTTVVSSAGLLGLSPSTTLMCVKSQF